MIWTDDASDWCHEYDASWCGQSNIDYRDSLSEINKDKEKYTLVLANPPFKGSLDYEAVSNDLLKIAKTKDGIIILIFIYSDIKTGQSSCCYCSDGVLFGSSKHIKRYENH